MNTKRTPESSGVRQAALGIALAAALVGVTVKASCKDNGSQTEESPHEGAGETGEKGKVGHRQREVRQRVRGQIPAPMPSPEEETLEEAHCLEKDGSLPEFGYDEGAEEARQVFHDCVEALSPEARQRISDGFAAKAQAIASVIESMRLEQTNTIPEMTDHLKAALEAKGCKFDIVFRSLGGLNGKDLEGNELSVQILSEVTSEGYTSFTAHIVWKGMSFDVAGDTEEELYSQIFQALGTK